MNLELLINKFKENPGISKTTLIVKLKKEGYYKINAKMGKYKFVFDKPKALGGTATGPTSAEMLLASTGACIISSLQIWSDILKINVDHIEASIIGTIDHRGRLGISEEIFPGLQDIVIDIKIDSNESEENIKKLIKAMEKHCPSYNTIVNPVKITTKIKLNRKNSLMVRSIDRNIKRIKNGGKR